MLALYLWEKKGPGVPNVGEENGWVMGERTLTQTLMTIFNLGRLIWASLMAQSEKAMAPHSSTLAWKIPWTEEPGRLQSTGSWRVGHDWATSLAHVGEGNVNPLQCSCLENHRDGGAWWAAVFGVAQCRTRLRRLSSSSSSSNGSVAKNLPANAGDRSSIPGSGIDIYPISILEKEMGTHSNILVWEIPWTEEPGGLHSSWGHKESDMNEGLIHI